MMNYEEAISELEWIYQNGFENDLSIIGTDRILDSIRIAIEALEGERRMTYEEALEYAKSYITLKGIPIDSKEATKCIVEALEKQIPKKPTYTGEKNVYGAVVRICNECGDKVCISPMAKEYENYCRSCGKRLTDWSEVE